ncbi:unnamed protein product [Urochloa humidicola]
MLTNATFSFHMPEEEEGEGLAGGCWKQRGAWMLPMSGLHGATHYDPELNAWVGISRSEEAYGHICACDVVPADPDDGDGDGGQPPASKLSKEKVIDAEDPAEQPVAVRLVYMGAKSRYCLVEYVLCTEDKKNDAAAETDRFSQEDGDDEEEQVEEEDPRTYMLRVTTFCLKLDENGDLTIGNSRRVRHYSVPEGTSDPYLHLLTPPVAFWM